MIDDVSKYQGLLNSNAAHKWRCLVQRLGMGINGDVKLVTTQKWLLISLHLASKIDLCEPTWFDEFTVVLAVFFSLSKPFSRTRPWAVTVLHRADFSQAAIFPCDPYVPRMRKYQWHQTLYDKICKVNGYAQFQGQFYCHHPKGKGQLLPLEHFQSTLKKCP